MRLTESTECCHDSDLADAGPLGDFPLLGDDPVIRSNSSAHALVALDDFVERIGDLPSHASRSDRQPDGEIPFLNAINAVRRVFLSSGVPSARGFHPRTGLSLSFRTGRHAHSPAAVCPSSHVGPCGTGVQRTD